jgi:myosin heavy subunit
MLVLPLGIFFVAMNPFKNIVLYKTREIIMNLPKMFKIEDGKNHVFTFVLVSTLFLLW